MTFNLKNILLPFVLSLSLTSCRADEDKNLNTEENTVKIKFENGFENLGQMVLNSTTQTSSQGQKHQLSTVKYIVSNIVLIKKDGTEQKYNYNNPDAGAFIIDQADAVKGINSIDLTKIPGGDYSKIRFGLGVSPESYILGAGGQAAFMKKAQDKEMFWSWTSGYIFMKLEGMYGAELKTKFMNHTGNKGDVKVNNTANLYREITLDLPVSAKVRSNVSPSIHFKVDFNKYLSGPKALLLQAGTPMNMGGMSMSLGTDQAMGNAPFLVDITDNLAQAFVVDHVHND
jgi:hypothetical protein